MIFPNLSTSKVEKKKREKVFCWLVLCNVCLCWQNHTYFQSPHSHIPYGEDGSGFYSDNTIGCYNVILESAPLMLQCIKATSVTPKSVFTIADFGCADGGTSMPLLYACVKELREIHGDSLPIHVIYEDQPVNDFKSLFLRLQGNLSVVQKLLELVVI